MLSKYLPQRASIDPNLVTHKDPNLTPTQMIVLIWVMTALAIAAVGLRVYIRFSRNGKLHYDDAWTIAALIFQIGMVVTYMPMMTDMYILLAIAGGGEPVPITDWVTFEHRTKVFLRCQFVIVLLFWSCIWSVKASFLAFYRMIFKGVQDWVRWAWWVVVLICFGCYIGDWITQMLSCNPVKDYFLAGECETSIDIYRSNVSLIYSTIVDIVCDALIMGLPVFRLYKMQISNRLKLTLGVLFLVGSAIIGMALARYFTTRGFDGQANPKWLCVMSVAEATTAIIVACAPSYRGLFIAKRNDNRDSSRRNTSTKVTDPESGSDTELQALPQSPSRAMRPRNEGSIRVVISPSPEPGLRGRHSQFDSFDFGSFGRYSPRPQSPTSPTPFSYLPRSDSKMSVCLCGTKDSNYCPNHGYTTNVGTAY